MSDRDDVLALLESASAALGSAAEAASMLVEHDSDGTAVGWRSRILVQRRAVDRLTAELRGAAVDVDASLLNGG